MTQRFALWATSGIALYPKFLFLQLARELPMISVTHIDEYAPVHFKMMAPGCGALGRPAGTWYKVGGWGRLG